MQSTKTKQKEKGRGGGGRADQGKREKKEIRGGGLSSTRNGTQYTHHKLMWVVFLKLKNFPEGSISHYQALTFTFLCIT